MDPADIMMVTYNRIELTKRTLESLTQSTGYPFNLIIVDNKSTDGTKEYLQEFCEENINKNNIINITLIFNESNRGIAIGRNQALTKSSSKWLCTIDNDVILPNNWLAECIDIINKNSNFGAIGVNLENTPYTLVNKNGKEFQEKMKGNLGTACMVFNRSLHKLIGFFNTNFGVYSHEDADFGFRTKLVGLKIGYIKENGIHLGEGENDKGEYREFKTKSSKENLEKFYQTCRDYISRKKPIYIPFHD